MGKIRWGVVGSGSMVKLWLCCAKQAEGMNFVAIASRTRVNSEGIASKF